MAGPRVTFYDVLPDGRYPLIAKMAEHAFGKGKRLLVHCQDEAVARELDEYLWLFRDDAFIPHEFVPRGATPADPDACVVLVDREEDPIGAEVLVMEHPASMDFAKAYTSVIDMVDHRDPARLAESRERFKRWRDHEVEPRYRR